MKPRFVGRLSAADVVTTANAALGFLAAATAAVDAGLAARLILLAAIADGLDGVLARRYGSSAAGEYLDSLADVASFGVAPALLATATVRGAWTGPALWLGAYAVPAAFVASAVVRLGLYTAHDSHAPETRGVPTTLAATIVAAAALAGVLEPTLVAAATVVLAVAMTLTVTYPDLHAADALVMGVVQAGAVVLPGWYGEGFAFGLLFLALAYLLLAPTLYWGRSPSDRPVPGSGGSDGDGPGTGAGGDPGPDQSPKPDPDPDPDPDREADHGA
jgi:CDP-diacylglycerol--serine O-phosphatidyltransferase